MFLNDEMLSICKTTIRGAVAYWKGRVFDPDWTRPTETTLSGTWN